MNDENKVLETTEESKNQILMEGMSKENIVVVNELIFKIDEQRKLYEKTVEYFKGNIERLETEYWFIDISRNGGKTQVKRYKDYRETQLKNTEQSLEQLKGQIEEQKQLLKKTSDFLELLNSHIEMKKTLSGDKVAIYDETFFMPIIDLILTIGYLDYE